MAGVIRHKPKARKNKNGNFGNALKEFIPITKGKTLKGHTASAYTVQKLSNSDNPNVKYVGHSKKEADTIFIKTINDPKNKNLVVLSKDMKIGGPGSLA